MSISGLFLKRPALRSPVPAGLLLIGLLFTRTVTAAPPIIVGDGASTACTEAALKDALFVASVRGGGTIKFNCGDAPTTLTVSPLTDGDPFGLVVFTIPDNTTINGRGLITIQDVAGKTTMLVPAHSTATVKGIYLTGASLAPAIVNEGTLILSDTTIDHNGGGGSDSVVENLGALVVHASTVSNNSANEVIVNQGTLAVTGSTFISNSEGSGIANNGTAKVTQSVFSGNTGVVGAGILNAGTLTVEHCAFSENGVESIGGAIRNIGTLLVTTSAFLDNLSNIAAGAIGGSATIERSQFVGNRAFFEGGALAGESYIIRHSLFTGNRADEVGGAIKATDVTLTNSTIAGNVAGENGGGIVSVNPPVLIHTSVTDNTPNDILVAP